MRQGACAGKHLRMSLPWALQQQQHQGSSRSMGASACSENFAKLWKHQFIVPQWPKALPKGRNADASVST